MFSLSCFDYTLISDICSYECHPLTTSRAERKQEFMHHWKVYSELTAMYAVSLQVSTVLYISLWKKNQELLYVSLLTEQRIRFSGTTV